MATRRFFKYITESKSENVKLRFQNYTSNS